MSISFAFIDDFIRDYFQYRNLTFTSRLFDNEISKLPFGQSRADRIIEQLTLYIHQFDINNLIDYWTQIEQRLLSTLGINSQQLMNVFTKIRINLYRCYLIHATQSSKMDKINEFFDRLTKILQQSNEWTKEWFALPFIQNPEEYLTFQIYFSKQWNELFWISLQNFLSTAFYHMISPKICLIEEDNTQQLNPQSTIIKPLISSSTRADPSMPQFAKISDDIQASSIEQQHQSNLTIMSKLRNKFLLNNKQNQSKDNLPLFSNSSKSIFIHPFQESTTGNQILLSTEEFHVDTSISNI